MVTVIESRGIWSSPHTHPWWPQFPTFPSPSPWGTWLCHLRSHQQSQGWRRPATPCPAVTSQHPGTAVTCPLSGATTAKASMGWGPPHASALAGLGDIVSPPLPSWQRGQWQAGTLGEGEDGGDSLTPPWAWESVLCVCPQLYVTAQGGVHPPAATHTLSVTCSVPIPTLSCLPPDAECHQRWKEPVWAPGAWWCCGLRGPAVTPCRVPWGWG